MPGPLVIELSESLFFPWSGFTINDRADIETTVLLLLVSVGFLGFLMTAKPQLQAIQTERMVAVSLADEVGAGLMGYGARG